MAILEKLEDYAELQHSRLKSVQEEVVSIYLAEDKTGHRNSDCEVETIAACRADVCFIGPPLDLYNFFGFFGNQRSIRSLVA